MSYSDKMKRLNEMSSRSPFLQDILKARNVIDTILDPYNRNPAVLDENFEDLLKILKKRGEPVPYNKLNEETCYLCGKKNMSMFMDSIFFSEIPEIKYKCLENCQNS
jgi:hypothetical protein